jgi:hypothetical protein
MRFIILSAVALLSTFVLFSCKKDNPIPPEEQPQVTLSLEDVSCTEAWIKLSTNNVSLPAAVELYRDSSLAETISLANTDSLLYIDSLLPNQTYSFHTVIHPYNHTDQVTSNQLPVTTMDTTSHNFTWQTWTFGGQAGSCTLYDVAIIDENDIWAVGEIYLLDTTGVPDPNAYNAVHWNGSQWELIRIKTNACGGVDYPPIKTVFAFSSDDILFAHIDGSISHYNGIEFTNDCSLITQLNGSVNKMWGISKNDFYVVSDNGFIAHYVNGNWGKIESGTDATLTDVYGVKEPFTGKLKILSTAEKLNNYKILTLTSNSAEDTLNWQPGTHLSGIWVDGRKTYVAGTDIWVNQYNQWRQKTSTGFFFTTIRGSASNNIYGIGPDGIDHFNGNDWHLIKQRPEGIVMLSGNCSSNIVAAVGFSTLGGVVGEAVILLAYKVD